MEDGRRREDEPKLLYAKLGTEPVPWSKLAAFHYYQNWPNYKITQFSSDVS